MHIETFELDRQANTSLTVYLHEPKPEFARVEKRPFLLVIPGGGYSFCSDREAEPIALKFAGEGYHTDVLRYHVGEHRDFQKALLDAEQSMHKIKQLDDCWRVDTAKIAVIGFSAGGHLATALSTLSTEKPSLCLLGYPAILKSFADVMQIEAPSLDECVTEKTPPTFLFSTFSDNVVPIENSLSYLKALEEHEVPFESHIFQEGLHGLSLATKWFGHKEEMIDPRFGRWFELAVEWLEINWAKQNTRAKSEKRLTKLDATADKEENKEGIEGKEKTEDKEETADKFEVIDILDRPLNVLWRSEKNQRILIECLPKLSDRSYYKIVRNFSLKQLAGMAPTIFSDSVLELLKERVER